MDYYTPELRARLSAEGKMLIAFIGVERFCQQQQIHHPELDALIDHTWTCLTMDSSSAQWDAWEEGFHRDDIDPMYHVFPIDLLQCLPENIKGDLQYLLTHCVEITAVGWGGEAYERSERHFEKVIAILEEHHIPLPAIEPFIRVLPRYYRQPVMSQEHAQLFRQYVSTTVSADQQGCEPQ